jgi:hypothetical protein
MKQILQNMTGQTRTLAIAGGGAVLAAVLTMFLPVAVLEAITGSTGLSELFPATAAPLGDTARALIAFGTGVMAFALLAVFLSRKNASGPKAKTAVETPMVARGLEEQSDSPFAVSFGSDNEKPQGASLLSQLRDKFGALIARARGDSEVKDLEDLPKLRNRDIHPDAPARMPISANRDLGSFAADPKPAVEEVELPGANANANARMPVAEPAVEPVVAVQPAIVEQPSVVAPVAQVPELQMPSAVPEVPAFEERIVEEQPQDTVVSLSQMVDRLEGVLASRHAQLQQLEDIARRALAESEARDNAVIHSAPAAAEILSEAAPEIEPQQPTVERRLESVEPTGAAISRPRNGDDALRSALETLHRMNARSN